MICKSFLGFEDERLICVKYEDLVTDPVITTERLGKHIGVNPNDFDLSVLETKVRGAVDLPRLGTIEISALRLRGLRELTAEYGYA